ncbi:dynein assembly factor 5, axonemal [Bradysia coprophila]|uniref:dynein assembly factor 5, axonemal n=1 Tax=Bradysia coprophila TaxID=38358 RepID=UPI00187D7FDA|nr:dynein assembly factor 5, axonemal [Bradysia coprophila]
MTESDLFEYNQLCNNIQHTDRSVRQNSLKKLLELCSSKNTEQEAAILFDHFHLHIIKCYADKFESCRCLAVEIMSSLLDTLPDNEFYIDIVVPVIARRVGQKEIIEESEELRLQLVQQLQQIIDKFPANELKGDRLKTSYNDIIDVLLKTLRDPYVNIQRECCSMLKSLANATPSFHCRAESLADPLIVLLKHRQWLSRAAALSALGVLAVNIPNGEAVVKIIVSVSPLLMDSMPQIRKECGLVGCHWLLKLRDRYSFFERIIPLVLCCLNDDHQYIRDDIQGLWEQCGRQYFNENENELSKIELVDYHPVKYPPGVQRPTLGCRAVVQRSLRVTSIILKEIIDWKEEVRLHSLKLLWQVVLHSEKAFTSKFIEILPTLSMSCMDEVLPVANEAIKVAELIGMLMDYDSWIGFALEGLQKTPNLGVLKCFAALYTGAEIDKAKDLHRIATILLDTNICHSVNSKYQETLLRFVDLLVGLFLNRPIEADAQNLSLSDAKGTEECLYTIIVKITALAEGNESLQELGKEILVKLAGDTLTVPRLHSKYMGRVIDSIEDLDSENSELSDVIILLHGLIILGGFQKEYLESMKKAIGLILDHATPSAKIKIFAAISKSMLNWSTTVDLPQSESFELLRKFVTDIIEPTLIWKAGRNSESLRAMATTALYSMSEGIGTKCPIFPELATSFVSLIEDHNVVTRAYAVRCMKNSTAFPMEQLKPIVYAILSRLDDPSAEVRLYAAQCIGELKLKVDAATDTDSWKIVAKHVFDSLILHLDGPEINFRKTLLDSMDKLTENETNAAVFRSIIAQLPASHPYLKELRDLSEK